CNVVYIEGHSHSVEAGAPILTVSDARNFASRGGVIELFEQGNRLRFVVNVENARRAGLRISSMLLQLASRVEGAER
ncbi:MAG TPA: YfiR family protein, partial [Steroidobacteraceae bacterium]